MKLVVFRYFAILFHEILLGHHKPPLWKKLTSLHTVHTVALKWRSRSSKLPWYPSEASNPVLQGSLGACKAMKAETKGRSQCGNVWQMRICLRFRFPSFFCEHWLGSFLTSHRKRLEGFLGFGVPSTQQFYKTTNISSYSTIVSFLFMFLSHKHLFLICILNGTKLSWLGLPPKPHLVQAVTVVLRRVAYRLRERPWQGKLGRLCGLAECR